MTAGSPDVIVVGGGIGGLSAAFALARKGFKVRVLERAADFGEVGAGLQIAPNCTRILAGYGLRTGEQVTEYENTEGGARVWLADGTSHAARLVIAADGLHSVARAQLVGDKPVNSAYVAYRGAVPIEKVRENSVSENDVSETDVVGYVGPRCHFVQYPLRGGEMFNQVAVFESARARAGEDDWGTPDELDAAFAHTTENVKRGLPLMSRDRWWRMFDRDPIDRWVYGRIALLGDAAHPPLQYIAQGARNEVLRARDAFDYSFTDWLYSTTALIPAQEPEMFTPIPLTATAAAAVR